METKTETNMEISMYKDFIIEMCTVYFIFSLFVVLLTVICPRNTLLCRTLSALRIIYSAQHEESRNAVFQSLDIFSVMVHSQSWYILSHGTFSVMVHSQSWYILLRQKTYQHDPQGLLINVISMITCHVVVM